VEDIHGNYYTITYAEDETGGDYYPAQMKYSMGKSTDGSSAEIFTTVQFYYEDRPDHRPRYIPTMIDMDKRLK
jgi:hypothetical protein